MAGCGSAPSERRPSTTMRHQGLHSSVETTDICRHEQPPDCGRDAAREQIAAARSVSNSLDNAGVRLNPTNCDLHPVSAARLAVMSAGSLEQPCSIMRLATPQNDTPAESVVESQDVDTAYLDGDALSAVLDEPEPTLDDIDYAPRGILLGLCAGAVLWFLLGAAVYAVYALI